MELAVDVQCSDWEFESHQFREDAQMQVIDLAALDESVKLEAVLKNLAHIESLEYLILFKVASSSVLFMF